MASSASQKPTPPKNAGRRAGIWDGERKRCLSPADACKIKGGVWDGKQCQPKTNPAESARLKGGVWDKATKTCKTSTVPR